MSPRATVWQLVALAVLSAGTSIRAQGPATNTSAVTTASWRRLGLPSINMGLAAAATGPLTAVWYSAAGGTIFVQTASGTTWETADGESWSRSTTIRPETAAPIIPPTRPEPTARVLTVAGDGRRAWSLGRDLWVSPDGGVSWTSVSGVGDSVIGAEQHDVAVHPRDTSSFAVVNDFGVWQSRDGGQSWAGLNDNLPNLPAARIASTQRGAIRLALADGRTLRLQDARSPWELDSAENVLEAETRDRLAFGHALNASITAIARGGELVYAGSADGRLWVSRDRGASWSTPQTAGHSAVERITVDAEAPRAAFSVLAGPGPRIVRTVNAGTVWDDVTGNLVDFAVHAAVGDRAAGVAYAATDRGVWMARVDLNTFSPSSNWVRINGAIPEARVVDVALDTRGAQIFAALEGFGLYTAPAPVRGGNLRVANAADFSTRPAAPGSVISVLGGKVTSARIGNLRFPVLAAGEAESQLQVPFEAGAPGGDLNIETSKLTASLPLAVRDVAPAIFVDHDGAPFLMDADTGLALDAFTPIESRARLQLMATGLGRVKPDWQTGVPAPAEHPPVVAANVQAYLDGAAIEVSKATLAAGYVGYYQVEVRLPAVVNAGPAELYLIVDGQESNRVRVLISAP